MRNIIEGPEFSNCVDKLGGHRLIDEVLEPVLDALSNNPYGFPLFENDWTSFRYVRTRGVGGYIPALIFVFRIDEVRNVVLEWVDEIDDAELPE